LINSITSSTSSLLNAQSSSMKARQEEMFAKMDSNGDGNIDKAEFAAFAPPQGDKSGGPKPSVDDMFAKMDSDGDGSITKAEMETFHKSHPRPPKVDSEQLFAQIDSNSDGSVTKAEFQAFLEQLEKQANSTASSTYSQSGVTIQSDTTTSVDLLC
jgi:Ca2+-binding EF-hand superfamily protein